MMCLTYHLPITTALLIGSCISFSIETNYTTVSYATNQTNSNDTALITERSQLSTSTPSSKVYLEKGNLKENYLRNDSSRERPKSHATPGRIETSVQIYIIFFIGIMPAAIGACAWWLQNLRHSCCTHKNAQSQNNINNNGNDLEKLAKGDKVDHLVYQIARRADKLNMHQNNVQYSGYRTDFIKSRRVYSLEVPRKCLEMVEILGEGNFGQVWKAKTYQIGNKSSAHFVAVKTNKVHTYLEHQEDLLKELDIMLQLGSHPNVVRLLGCCTENEPYYLVMEYVSQGKLLSFLRQHRKDAAHYFEGDAEWQSKEAFINHQNYMTYHNNTYGYSEIKRKHSTQPKMLTPFDLIQFAYQISKGMEFITSHGIIHRDLAARNILVDENKNCKIADFGLSRSIREKESDMYEMRHGGQMPIRWMSPESLSMGIFSVKSDVWAYGIVMWEIVTLGSTPYIGMSASEVVNFIRQGNICLQPDHCSDFLYDLMKSCWAYKADDRFTFTEIKHNLMKVLLNMQDQGKDDYIDLEHFNNSLYYFNINESPDEKL